LFKNKNNKKNFKKKIFFKYKNNKKYLIKKKGSSAWKKVFLDELKIRPFFTVQNIYHNKNNNNNNNNDDDNNSTNNNFNSNKCEACGRASHNSEFKVLFYLFIYFIFFFIISILYGI
jgi:hypothetical protein